ncbi:Coat protein [Mesorhizobium sp. B2-1-3A]|uniref:Coat protein n=1 Tax=Mesorhizobium sp. B2-1-3A TaxID=2589971 RepID=UPI00112DAD92|nr:Coat protein [Mesorhizobium sp. B2-1-3A]TPM89859.1 Coat protein [Mesorhizobium sp. B2-1-3A]
MADAWTKVTDSIVPSVYAQYNFEEHVQSLEIYQAGILFSDPAVASKLSMGGRVVDMPGWKDLGNDPSEPVNDDPTDSIEMKKIGSRRETAARNVRAQAWGIPDLTSILAGDDPQKVIVRRQTDYWQRANKLTLIKILAGVLADNAANDSGDMIRTTGASIVDTDIIEAAYLYGDRADQFKTIWMHSKQMKALKLADLIDFVPSSQQGGVMIPYYMQYRVVVDDDIPNSAGVYTAFMFKNNAIMWNELPVDTEGGPLEFDRKPRQAHGGGVTEMVARRHFVPHVPGTRFLAASVAGQFATDAELATAANWDRTASSVKSMTFLALKTTEA